MESTFVTRVATELSQIPPAFDSSRDGLGQLMLLPEMPTKFQALATEEFKAAPVSVHLRSIRAPKFEVSYELATNDTVYAIKQKLLRDTACPLNQGPAQYAASNIKLMLGAKVVADTRIISELAKTSFTIMLTGEPAGKQVSDVLASAVVEPTTEIKSKDTVPAKKEADADQMWQEISQVLAKHNKLALLQVLQQAAAANSAV